MREAMIPRGPDGGGSWMTEDKRVGLDHRRLAILDLTENGAQPMATPDWKLRVVFNGEIDNYRALRDRLKAKGHMFTSGTDTELDETIQPPDIEASRKALLQAAGADSGRRVFLL